LTSAIEESAELFDHSVSHLLLDDAQPLLDSDAGSEVEDDRNMSLERGRNTGRQIGIHVPQAAAYCQVVSSDRAEEETEGEAAQPQEGRHQERVKSSHPIPSRSAAVISRPTPQSSAVWAFFSTSAADRTVAMCKLCLRHIKRGKNTNHIHIIAIFFAFIKSTSIGLRWEGAPDTHRVIFLHLFDRCISLQFFTARPILAFIK
ncbi:hypothetical protein AB205_0124120, partial [Aquarana catesbeiana]